MCRTIHDIESSKPGCHKGLDPDRHPSDRRHGSHQSSNQKVDCGGRTTLPRSKRFAAKQLLDPLPTNLHQAASLDPKRSTRDHPRWAWVQNSAATKSHMLSHQKPQNARSVVPARHANSTKTHPIRYPYTLAIAPESRACQDGKPNRQCASMECRLTYQNLPGHRQNHSSRTQRQRYFYPRPFAPTPRRSCVPRPHRTKLPSSNHQSQNLQNQKTHGRYQLAIDSSPCSRCSEALAPNGGPAHAAQCRTLRFPHAACPPNAPIRCSSGSPRYPPKCWTQGCVD